MLALNVNAFLLFINSLLGMCINIFVVAINVNPMHRWQGYNFNNRVENKKTQ